MTNSNLLTAKSNKNDEFYTMFSTIEKELIHYPVNVFNNKIVYLPCDEPCVSEFWNYFHINFKRLGIKKLVATFKNYGLDNTYGSYYLGGSDLDTNSKVDFYYDGDGDFRSEYCTRLLQEADIVVTNPPFSLFGDFIKLLLKSEKKFLIIGNRASYSQDYIFDSIKNNILWTGSSKTHQVLFTLPPEIDADLYNQYIRGELKVNLGSGHDKSYTLTKDNHIVKGINACWYTNINWDKRFEDFVGLSMQDNIAKGVKYVKYDDFDALDVSKVNDIPMDYDGVMGVPITFIDKYNPNQFELLQILKKIHINGKVPYARILIKRRV